ncbi:PREDICTED: uncharacterized protein LOC104592347 [Nelumbo nucifera]|uniref:Uncharacterized protein LOC104592347 n=2 Tax=Nelumbo nucifera TaxID=4432 RepID=A0A1U7Z959_NELNU|nr:PREDICTED: uncharacterized protein LOC104592347 [Nelumbo nucifera]DAD44836.1 TPA_asm: hypothetical protein HUJ06_003066 [Nelumbo nucifera]
MATTFLSFQPAGIQACASSGRRKPDSCSRKASSSNSLTPFFVCSSHPDHAEDNSSNNDSSDASTKKTNESETHYKAAKARSRFPPGCFTEEKARQLRMKTMKNANFHDIMYHSAIASRLASDPPNRANEEGSPDSNEG